MNLNKYLKKIIELTKKIVFKLKLEKYKHSKLNYLQDSKFYFHIFSAVFGNSFLKERNNINYFMLASNDQIQYLINFLEEDILKIELEHINGKEIGMGNVKVIKEFLEILNYLTKNLEEEEDKIINSKEKNKEIKKDYSEDIDISKSPKNLEKDKSKIKKKKKKKSNKSSTKKKKLKKQINSLTEQEKKKLKRQINSLSEQEKNNLTKTLKPKKKKSTSFLNKKFYTLEQKKKKSFDNK